MKAHEIAQHISEAAGPDPVSLATLVERYLTQGVSPFNEQPWKQTHKNQLGRCLRRVVRGYEDVRAMGVDRTLPSPAIMIPAMRVAGWALLEWDETRGVWDKKTRTYRREVRQRTSRRTADLALLGPPLRAERPSALHRGRADGAWGLGEQGDCRSPLLLVRQGQPGELPGKFV
jgi:hypothetical protein